MSGEPRALFSERVAGTAREIARRHPDQRVLAVIHMAVRSNMLAPGGWRPECLGALRWVARGLIHRNSTGTDVSSIVRLKISDHLTTLRSNP